MTEQFSPEITLDRNSSVPLHAQISEPIAQAILDGKITPGTLIENEVGLAERLQVSRPTARRAMQTLVDKGLLLRRRGAGTLVAPKSQHRLPKITSLMEDLQREGANPSTKVVLYKYRRATSAIAEQLQCPVGAQVVELERLRLRNGVPVALLYNWIPVEIAPAAEDLAHHGLYQLFNANGITIASTTQSVGAERPTRREAGLLAISTRQPVLSIERTAFDPSGNVIEWGLHAYRGDAYRYESTVLAQVD